jgi:hypothetical protein
MADEARIERVARALEIICLGFAALGAVLPFAYGSPLFALYRAEVATAIGDAAMASDGGTLRLVLGITGGSIAGKWIAHWAVVRFGLRARMRWARDATLAGLVSWLVLDSVSSLAGGAWANVAFVNGLPPLLVLPLLALVWGDCDRTAAPASREHASPARLALASALFGCGTGLVIALAMETAAFDTWRAGLSSAFFAGEPVPASARALVRFFAGPIGGSTLGQFVLLAYVARHAMPSGERWAWRWSLLSVLVWAGVDSAYCLACGGAFNVVLVNVPCLALVVPPLLWAGSRAERAPS